MGRGGTQEPTRRCRGETASDSPGGPSCNAGTLKSESLRWLWSEGRKRRTGQGHGIAGFQREQGHEPRGVGASRSWKGRSSSAPEHPRGARPAGPASDLSLQNVSVLGAPGARRAAVLLGTRQEGPVCSAANGERGGKHYKLNETQFKRPFLQTCESSQNPALWPGHNTTIQRLPSSKAKRMTWTPPLQHKGTVQVFRT